MIINTKDANPTMSTERLIFFSDGVFAIAITLLVLEIKIPSHETLLESGGLAKYLIHIWPSYFSYFISFFVIGIYWSNHHWLFTFIIKRTNHIMNLLHILFLMTVAYIPFSTAVFGDFVMDPENRQAAVKAYTLGYLFPIPTVLLMFLYARKGDKLIDIRLDKKYIQKQVNKLYASMSITGLAFVLAFFQPWWSVLLILASFILYFLPPDKPVYESNALSTDLDPS